MPTVSDILSSKGESVYTISPDATALEAINKMNQHKIGALLVMRGSKLIGMFTERDVLRRVAGALKSPADVLVADVMTREVFCCPPHTDIDDAALVMKERRVRHLPVTDSDEHICGMVSIGDINACHVSQAEATITFLNDYIYGRA